MMSENKHEHLVGFRMRQLFVKGEVTAYNQSDDGLRCFVLITNDGWYVCRHVFLVQDKSDLEKQFYAFLETDEFQNQLRRREA